VEPPNVAAIWAGDCRPTLANRIWERRRVKASAEPQSDPELLPLLVY